MADNKSTLRVPPHSQEAEESVIGAMLIDKDAVIAVAEFLQPEDFYDERLRDIYTACIDLYEARSPIDVLTVTERLKKKKTLKNVGSSSFLADLANKVPTAAHVEHYGRIVKDTATKRSLMSAATRLVEVSMDDGMAANEALDKAESEIFSLSQKSLTKAFTSVRDTLAASFDRLDELHKTGAGIRGVPTGFPDLDDALAGMQQSNLIILAARPGVGKCVAGDTLIIDSKTGKRQKIADIVNQKKGNISTLNSNFKIRGNIKPLAFVDDGKKTVYEIRTALGNKLEATAVHPLLTINGWKKVEELEKGTRIAVPRKIDFFGNKTWESWKVKTLAYLLGDGGVTSSCPKFTNSNPIVLADFCESVEKFGEVTTKLASQSKIRLRTPTVTVINKNPYKKELRGEFAKRINKKLVEAHITQRRMASILGVSPALVNAWVSGVSLPGASTYKKLNEFLGEESERIDRKNPVTDWLTNLGVMGKLSIEKEIPAEVFELSRKNLSTFLNRLFACEGSIMPSKFKGTGRISFSSSSYKLAEGVKHLLLRFGILARLREKKIKYKGDIKKSYELEIMGASNILTFIREIGVFGKEHAVSKIEKLAKSKESSKNWSKDTLPMDIWKLIIEEKGTLTWGEIYRRIGRSSTHNIHVNKRQLKRETLKEIAKALNSKKLLDLAESDLYWDRIISIKPSGKKQVFDLTIDKTHNFIANDIVVHNTSLAMNIAQYVTVELKRPVGFFSLEMSREELVDRLLVGQADIDAWKLKTGKLSEEDFTKLSNAMGELAEAPLFIDDTPALSVLEMRTKARRLQVENGLDFLIVDYLQLARSRNLENRVQEVSEISQGMKNLARELKIPVIVISQLSRAVENRVGKKPQLSDLRESGCLLGETLTTLADTGEQVSIEDLVGRKKFNVFSLNSKMKLVKAKVSKVFPSGKKTVFKLLLKSGRNIKASANHKFLKVEGWQRLDELKVGDRIATPRILEVGGKNKLSDNKLILLAHLIGDGCYVKKQPLHYTNSESELINIVKKSAMEEFDINPRIVKQNSWYHLYLAANEKLARGRRNPIVRWLDEDLHIYGQHSRVKVLPSEIFELTDSKIKLFLKHLWATDGCIHIQKGGVKSKVSVYYASGSPTLSKQVQHLLLRLGILSTITISKKKGYEDINNVIVQGKNEQTKFLKMVGCVGKKKTKAKEALEFLENVEENPNNDVVPKEVWNLIKEIMKEKGITTRKFHEMLGWSYSGTQRYRNGIGRERLIKICSALKDKNLKNLATSDVYWDEIKSIKKEGIKTVYDATVPGEENFVANDIVVHNSIEQDADVVMFLWREDDDNNENFMLDIAKHRNGPLKSIPLHFKGDRIKFYSRDSKHTK